MKKEMTNTQINEAVAKALGFSKVRLELSFPDFCNDLNACVVWMKPQCDYVDILLSDGMANVAVKINMSERSIVEKSAAKAWCLAFLKAKGVDK